MDFYVFLSVEIFVSIEILIIFLKCCVYLSGQGIDNTDIYRSIKDIMNTHTSQNMSHKSTSMMRVTHPVAPINIENQESFNDLSFIAQKAQKILTALYMVTDFLSVDDPVRKQTRVDMSHITQTYFYLLTGSQESSRSLVDVYNLLVSVCGNVALMQNIGLLSVMNANVLTEEILGIMRMTSDYLKQYHDSSFDQKDLKEINDFSFGDNFFAVAQKSQGFAPSSKSQDISLVKKDEVKEVSQNPLSSPAPEPIIKKTPSSLGSIKSVIQMQEEDADHVRQTKGQSVSAKAQRHKVINTILSQKRNVSINDIADVLQDCSTKTIQRDLQDMINTGHVVKQGDRRWSVYNLVHA